MSIALSAQNYHYTLNSSDSAKEDLSSVLTDKEYAQMLTSAPTPVEKYGHLQVSGNKFCDKNGNPIQLNGMSLFWSQWMGDYWNSEVIEWLADDWKCSVIRAALAADHQGGYLDNPEIEMKKLKEVIEACIDKGIYVIVDWHSHNAIRDQDKAVEFFTEISQTYGDAPNVLFEPFNEPLPGNPWNNVKSYHEIVIPAIRKYSSNPIICGTQDFSGGSGLAAVMENPLKGYTNVAYTLHFYSGSYYNATPRETPNLFLNSNLPILVTEYGMVEDSGNGFLDHEEIKLWWNWMDTNYISSANWAISEAPETSAAIKPGSNTLGHWKKKDLNPSGYLIRERLRNRFFTLNFPAAIDTIIDKSINLKSANRIYPNYWTIIEVDTGVKKEADGFTNYTDLPNTIQMASEAVRKNATKLKGKIFTKFKDAWDKYNKENAFDDNESTYYVAYFWAANDKYIGIDLGENNEKVITKVRILPKPGYSKQIKNIHIQGSNLIESAGYTSLYFTDEIPTEDVWYEFEITDPRPYRFLRLWRAKNSQTIEVSEIEFYGYTDLN